MRLTAAAALLARNDISVLPMAHRVLTNPETPIDDETRQNLLSAIYEGVSNKKAIPTFTLLLANSDVRVRRVAAMALRNTQSAERIDALVLTLMDNDFEVRYYGVIGLAEITGQDEWHPLMEEFTSKEGYYLAHWKQWAQNEKIGRINGR